MLAICFPPDSSSFYSLHPQSFPINYADENPAQFSRTTSFPRLTLEVGCFIPLKTRVPAVRATRPGFLSSSSRARNDFPTPAVRPQELCPMLFLSTASTKTSFISKAFNGPVVNFFFYFFYCKPISQLSMALNGGGNRNSSSRQITSRSVKTSGEISNQLCNSPLWQQPWSSSFP